MASLINPQLNELDILKKAAAIPYHVPIPPDLMNQVWKSPPFVLIEGALNLRDCSALCPEYLAPGKLYRSGAPDFMPAASRQFLRTQLGIKRIHDLRRIDEVRQQASSPAGGPETVLSPYMDGRQAPRPIVLADFAPAADRTPGLGFQNMYDDMLQGHTTGYRRVFENIRDLQENEAVLFHCTAGKDRTGILAALVLDLMGVPEEIIGLDYTLTRIGNEPLREKLMPLAMKWINPASPEGNIPSALAPGTDEFLSINAGIIICFIRRLHATYGNTQGYMQNVLGFSEQDIEKIRGKIAAKGQE